MRGVDVELEALFWPRLPRTFGLVPILTSIANRLRSERPNDLSPFPRRFCAGCVACGLGGAGACGALRHRHVRSLARGLQEGSRIQGNIAARVSSRPDR